MSRVSPVRTLLRRAGLPAVVLIAIAFFGYNAVLGPTGIMAARELIHAVRDLKIATTNRSNGERLETAQGTDGAGQERRRH